MRRRLSRTCKWTSAFLNNDRMFGILDMLSVKYLSWVEHLKILFHCTSLNSYCNSFELGIIRLDQPSLTTALPDETSTVNCNDATSWRNRRLWGVKRPTLGLGGGVGVEIEKSGWWWWRLGTPDSVKHYLFGSLSLPLNPILYPIFFFLIRMLFVVIQIFVIVTGLRAHFSLLCFCYLGCGWHRSTLDIIWGTIRDSGGGLVLQFISPHWMQTYFNRATWWAH